MKVADTVRAWSIVTTQAPEPVHAPPHIEKTEPMPAEGVKVTIVSWS